VWGSLAPEPENQDANPHPVRLAYQPPASSTFLSEQTSHQQSASITLLSEQTSTSHQPPATSQPNTLRCQNLTRAYMRLGGGATWY
jgi:hypothetical protein